jgi:kumamolisin
MSMANKLNTKFWAQLVVGLVIATSAIVLLFDSFRSGHVNTPRTISTYNHPGRSPQNLAVKFDVVLEPRSWSSLSQFVYQVSDPASKGYLKFVTTKEFATDFGAGSTNLDAATKYFSQFGLRPGSLWTNGVVLPMSGTVSQASKALGVSFYQVHVANGYQPQANGPWEIGKSIKPLVVSILGIYPNGSVPYFRRVNDLRRIPAGSARAQLAQYKKISLANSLKTSGLKACPAARSNAKMIGALLPSQIASLYGMNRLYASGDQGQRVTIALPEFAQTTPSSKNAQFKKDLNIFRSCVGSNSKISYINVGPGSHDSSTASLEEAELDTETALSLAPKAKLDIYSAPQAMADQLYLKMVAANQAQVIVGSWGLCESQMASTDIAVEKLAFAEAAAQGQTVLFASGDSGSEDCYSQGKDSSLSVDDPASQTYVTGVGGLMLDSSAPNGERVWSDVNYSGASGGGTSSIHLQPPFQFGPGVDSQQAVANCHLVALCREVPDVSALAEGFLVYAPKYKWDVLGGTSAAAPVVGAGVSLLISGLGHRIGLLAPALYRLSAIGSSAISDVTVGNNDYLNAHHGIFSAAPGYDPASGVGFIHFDRLLPYLKDPSIFH